MKILLFGGAGMLGHKVWQMLATRHDTLATVRDPSPLDRFGGIFADATRRIAFDAGNSSDLPDVIAAAAPAVVVNCIGVVKQLREARNPIPSIRLNALFPHEVAKAAGEVGARVIHVSTDCVFSGATGGYVEDDFPDAADLYGRTKLLGELSAPGTLTLRTSIIGREVRDAKGLVEWFLSQRGGHVKGYTNAWFSGVTTLELARLIAQIIEQHRDLSGVYHVSADRIDKHSLLTLLNTTYDSHTEIVPDPGVVIDRSLDSARFRRTTGWRPPTWESMVREMAEDPTPYETWRTIA